jgi:hypothetical protein
MPRSISRTRHRTNWRATITQYGILWFFRGSVVLNSSVPLMVSMLPRRRYSSRRLTRCGSHISVESGLCRMVLSRSARPPLHDATWCCAGMTSRPIWGDRGWSRDRCVQRISLGSSADVVFTWKLNEFCELLGAPFWTKISPGALFWRVVSCKAVQTGLDEGSIAWVSSIKSLIESYPNSKFWSVGSRRRIYFWRRAPALECNFLKGKTCSSKTTSRENLRHL